MLADVTIGLSISDADDLAVRGFSQQHLAEAAIRFAEVLLASGARLAYGGDLRPGGFTETLFHVVASYNATGTAVERVHDYLVWPRYRELSADDKAKLMRVAVLKPIPPPSDLAVDEADPTKLTARPDCAYVVARCLTAMRTEMTAAISGRILVGGKTRGFSGRWPGLLEEASLALDAHKPVFVLGGMGGCASAIAAALNGEAPSELTPAHAGASVEDLDVQYRAAGFPFDFSAAVSQLRECGIAGLNNGLTDDENRRLFVTPFVDEMILLVMRGLAALRRKAAVD